MGGTRITTCSRYVRFVGDNKAPETWPFSIKFVPKGELEGFELRGRVRGSLHLLQMGAGVCSLLQKDSFCSWLDDLAVGLFCGE
jgi:hypothetical protein